MNTVKESFEKEINSLFWLFLLQGFCFVILGIWIYFQPMVLFALVIAGFLVFGIMLITTSIRIKKFGKKLEEAFEGAIRK